MRKTITIISILIISAIIALLWVKIDTALLKKQHPLEYYEIVEQYSTEYSVPKELVLAVIKTESGFNSSAVSKKGAVGLMQIMPDTYVWLCEKLSEQKVDENYLYTPEINIKCGVYYLDMLYSEFGSWETALCAYNAGPSKVRGWLKDENISENGLLVNIPYPETEEYVKKVMKAKQVYDELYNVKDN